MRMKYVMVNCRDLPTPVMFPESLGHDEVCHRDHRSNKWSVGSDEVLSAGFVNLKIKENHKSHDKHIEAECFGESVTLGMKPAQMDEDDINRFFKMMHF